MTRRLASFVALLFFAQLSVVGGVARCWLAASGAHESHSVAATGHEGNHGDTPAPEQDKGETLPGCTATSMCVVVMMPPIAGDVAPDELPEHARLAAAPSAPLSISQAPELPPPRG